jgi:carbamate kinase
MPRERVVLALGGNALARAGGTDSWSEAVATMRRTAPSLARACARGTELILTHGNGPQVGMVLRQNEIAQREVPSRPLDVLGAETQGQIGYLIQQELAPALRTARIHRSVLSFVTRMLVSRRDPAFRNPTKPVGQFYSENEARLLRKGKGWSMIHDPARGGWRRVVPSPLPIQWVEGDSVAYLLDHGLGERCVPVVAGGGGVPVVDRGRGRLEGVEAVIDKDLSAAVVAKTLHAQTLVIVTDVPAIAVGFRRPWERWLGEVTDSEMREHLERGEFGAGSMAPKVESALRFLADGGRQAIITDVPGISRALRGEAGTRVIPSR